MKLFVVLIALVGVVVSKELGQFYSPDYHTAVGIPAATRIKAGEEAQDFDGARIVGGSPSQLGQFPYFGGLVVHLTTGALSMCGSTLLTHTRSLTAAHCWAHGSNIATHFTIVLGSIRLFTGTGTHVISTEVLPHEEFQGATLRNDVAVIKHEHVTYTDIISGIPIATGSDLFVGAWATTCGYGRTSDTSILGYYSFLSHVEVQVVDNEDCVYRFTYDSTLCINTRGANSTCSGDSGGPLVSNGMLIGVTSFATASCQMGFPTGFARVSYFAPWIQERL